MSVCDHLVAPGSAGLFRAAIIQSGPCQAQLAAARRASGPASTTRATPGCGDPRTAAACLRALPADKLRKPVWYYRIGEDTLSGPVTGNATSAGGSDDGDRRGARPPKVPVLIGTNRDEFTLVRRAAVPAAGTKPYTAGAVPAAARADTFGADAAAVGDALSAEPLRRQRAARRTRRRSPTGCSPASPIG